MLKGSSWVMCLGVEEGGHRRAMGHWRTVLECGFQNTENQGWHGLAREHGVAVPNCCLRSFGLHGFCRFVLFLYFCLRNVFGLQAWSNGNLSSDTK